MAEPSSNRAVVSGPGQLSRRTDGGPAQKLRDLPDAQYGEAATYRDLQKAAPLAQTPQPGRATKTSGSSTGVTPSVIPLNAPSVRPDEPVTAGSAYGPGPGPESLGLHADADYSNTRTTLQAIAAASGNPEAKALLNVLSGRF
jgi:hypothetical protein